MKAVHESGFTLIESALAIVIIGVGVVASMQLFVTCTQQNQAGMRMNSAMMLANNVQELISTLPFWNPDPGYGNAQFGPTATQKGAGVVSYNNVTAFQNASINPPIDMARIGHPELKQYSQVITVEPVDPFNLNKTLSVSAAAPSGGYTFDVVRVTVRILYGSAGAGQEVYRTSWLRSNE